jgi:hypothetical protein
MSANVWDLRFERSQFAVRIVRFELVEARQMKVGEHELLSLLTLLPMGA